MQRMEKPDAVYNGWPIDLMAPPIEIYHPAFATFQTKAAAGIDHSTFNSQDLNLEYDLVVNSANFYKNEDEWKKKNYPP